MYIIICSKSGRGPWEEVSIIDTWSNIWESYKGLKLAHPENTYFIINTKM